MTVTPLSACRRNHKLIGIGFLTLILLWAPSVTELYGQDAAAVVNGESVTYDQLNSAIRMQLDAINEQVSVLKQTALNRLIDNLLVEQAAKGEKISIEAYLAKYVEHINVQDAEVDAAYEKSKLQLPATLAPEAKYRIRRTLEDERRAEAMRSLLRDLRQNARVRNLLLENISMNLDLGEKEGPSIGPSNAPVTIVVFDDFECPFCRSAAPVLRQAAKTWGAGVRLLIKNFPLSIHSNAFGLAKAGYCSAGEGHFWDFFDHVFADSNRAAEFAASPFADQIGVDRARFAQCISSPDAERAVLKDIELGRAAGVNATPTIFVNKQKLNSLNDLDGAIRQAMRAAVPVKR